MQTDLRILLREKKEIEENKDKIILDENKEFEDFYFEISEIFNKIKLKIKDKINIFDNIGLIISIILIPLFLYFKNYLMVFIIWILCFPDWQYFYNKTIFKYDNS